MNPLCSDALLCVHYDAQLPTEHGQDCAHCLDFCLMTHSMAPLQGVMKALNVNKLTKCGVTFKFWYFPVAMHQPTS